VNDAGTRERVWERSGKMLDGVGAPSKGVGAVWEGWKRYGCV